MPPLDESVATHLWPPSTIDWKAKAVHPSKLFRTTTVLAGRSYASAGQAASALHYGGPPGLSGQTPLFHGGVWAVSSDSQGTEKCYRPGPAHHQDLRPGDREVHGQPSGARVPPLVHTDGN